MRIVVIEGPAPIATPQDVPGKHDSADARIAGVIAAAQSQIDGPTGWLNRAIGVQTLELEADCWPAEIPYRPIIDLVSVTVNGAVVSGVTATRDGRLKVVGASPVGSTVIRYRAGYDGTRNGPVPSNAKMAVVLMAQEIMANQAENGGLRSFEVDGAFSEGYNSPDQVQRSRSSTVEGLLHPLRVYV